MTRMTRKLLFVLTLWVLPMSLHAALIEISSDTSLTGNGGFGSAFIDPVGGLAYFGSSTTFTIGTSTVSAVVGVNISTFGIVNNSFYFNQITNLAVSAFDQGTRFGYFVSTGSPAGIEAISYTSFFGVAIASTTFASGQNNIGTAVIDSTNHFGYFGTQTSPSIVIKVQLPDGVNVSSISIISTITLPSGLNFLSASVIDTQNGFAYFGSSTTPGAVAKIDLSNFTLAGPPLTFASGEGGVGSAVIDVAGGTAYFGTHDSPGKVIKVGLASFSETGSRTLSLGDNDLTTAVIDPTVSLAVFGTNTSSGIVIPIHLNDFSKGTETTLPASFLRSAVIDSVNHYATFGTYTTPGSVLKVDMIGGLPEIFAQPTNAIVHAGENVTLAILAEGRSMTYQWQKNGINIPGATSAGYSFIAASADDQATLDCIVTNSNGSTASALVTLTIIPVVKAFPNPWRADRHTGIPITFDGLLPNSTVKIFNLAAHWVKTLPAGTSTWDLKNDAGQMVASGYYLFLSTTGNANQTSHGKIAVIR